MKTPRETFCASKSSGMAAVQQRPPHPQLADEDREGEGHYIARFGPLAPPCSVGL